MHLIRLRMRFLKVAENNFENDCPGGPYEEKWLPVDNVDCKERS
jgi:hypothetical protein